MPLEQPHLVKSVSGYSGRGLRGSFWPSLGTTPNYLPWKRKP